MRRWFCLIDATSFQTSPREFSLNPTGDVMLTVGDTTAISHDLFYSSWSKKNSGSLDLLSLWIFLLFLASLINFFPNGMTPNPLAPGGPPAETGGSITPLPRTAPRLPSKGDSRRVKSLGKRWKDAGDTAAVGIYPSWKITIISGRIHYKWTIFNSYVKLPEGNIYIYLVGGLEHKKSIYWECHHPNWRTHIFQTGRYTSNQICIYIYIDRDRNFVMGFCWGLSESFFLVTRMLLFDANVGKVLACACFCREHWWKNNGCPLWRWCRCADLYPSSYSLQYLFHHQETPEI